MKKLKSYPIMNYIIPSIIFILLLFTSPPSFSDTESLFETSVSVSNKTYAQNNQKEKVVEIASELKVDSLYIELFDGIVVEAVRDNIIINGKFTTWVGHLRDSNDEVFLTIKNGHIVGKIDFGEETYLLKYNKVQKLVKIIGDEAEPKKHSNSIVPKIEETDINFFTPPQQVNAVNESDTVIDLLVGYTTQAKVNSGGVAGIELKIVNAVAMTNQAYINSGVHINLRLVAMREINYVENGQMATTLAFISGQNYMYTSPMIALRNQYGADVVTVVSSDADVCGVGYQMTNTGFGPQFAPFAYNVVHDDSIYSCLGNYTLAHETGHNMGNAHNIEDAVTPGAYTYSYGYRLCEDNGFRTIMSYVCYGAPKIGYFSNPDVYYNGKVIGSVDKNNSLSMNNTRFAVSNFRQSITIPPPPPVDTIYPTITNVVPIDNQVITTQLFTISATGNDNVAIKNMQVFIDDVLQSIVTTPTISYNWDLTQYANGAHKITIIATDTSNNVTDKVINVTKNISSGDTIYPSIINVVPVNNKIITTKYISLQATGKDNVAIKNMKILIDGVLVKTVTTPNISYSWNLTTYAFGTHKITFRATDTSNNVTNKVINVTKNIK